MLRRILSGLKLTRKFPTWRVMLQNRKSKELTVNFTSCGSYDLIWFNALNLTNFRDLFYIFLIEVLKILVYMKFFCNNRFQAVHGCRQFVFWYVRLSPVTNVTLLTNLFTLLDKIINLILFTIKFSILLKSVRRRVWIMSSRYALYRLGYAYDTMVVTIEKCGIAPKQIF